MFSDKFQQITKLDFEIISTVDHPYISPPIRLLDSHHKLLELNKKQRVCILNWDVSQPNDRTYRYDLQIDLGFITKNRSLLLFDDKTPYALQTPKPVDINLYEKILHKILKYEFEQDKLTTDSIDTINKNYLNLKNSVISKVVLGEDKLGANYTQLCLSCMYSLLSLHDMSDFINENYLYYFKSSIMNKWIPHCIETASGKRAIEEVAKSGVFGRKIFRSSSTQLDEVLLNDPAYIRENKNQIANLIKNNEIIPSVEVLYWALELAGKYHYGNDYGYFERYQKYLNEQLSNQLTLMKDDGINYFQIKNDHGVECDNNSWKCKSKSSFSQVKNTRINSMFAIYLLIGDKMSGFQNQPTHTRTIEIINGIIMVT